MRYLLILLLAGLCQAADTEAIRPAKGVMTLDFALSSYMTLQKASGGSLSMRYWLSDRSALSAGITISGRNQTTTYLSIEFPEDSLVVDEKQRDEDVTDIAIEWVYQRILRGRNPVLLAGLGPMAGYIRSDRVARGPRDYLGSEDEYRTRFIGLRGQIAAEWFFGHGFSLSGMYLPSVEWESRESTRRYLHPDNSSTSYNNKSKGWSVSAGSVRLGLSFWFD